MEQEYIINGPYKVSFYLTRDGRSIRHCMRWEDSGQEVPKVGFVQFSDSYSYVLGSIVESEELDLTKWYESPVPKTFSEVIKCKAALSKHARKVVDSIEFVRHSLSPIGMRLGEHRDQFVFDRGDANVILFVSRPFSSASKNVNLQANIARLESTFGVTLQIIEEIPKKRHYNTESHFDIVIDYSKDFDLSQFSTIDPDILDELIRFLSRTEYTFEPGVLVKGTSFKTEGLVSAYFSSFGDFYYSIYDDTQKLWITGSINRIAESNKDEGRLKALIETNCSIAENINVLAHPCHTFGESKDTEVRVSFATDKYYDRRSFVRGIYFESIMRSFKEIYKAAFGQEYKD